MEECVQHHALAAVPSIKRREGLGFSEKRYFGDQKSDFESQVVLP
jgi:hypothetical protein